MNTPQRDMGKPCWDYSLKTQCVSVAVPLGLSHFWLQTGSKRHHNPPCPGAIRHAQLGVHGPTAAPPTALGKGSKACRASLSTAEQ